MKKLFTAFMLASASLAQAELKMNLFELTVKPTDQQAMIEVGRVNLGTSVQTEAGTLAMYHTTQKTDPTRHVVLEVYQDEQAYRQHTQAPHFKKFADVARP